MKRTPLVRKTEFVTKKKLTAKKALARKSELKATSTLKRDPETALARSTPLPRKRETPRVVKPEKAVQGKLSVRSERAPERSAVFLAFVRLQPCDVDGCPHPAEAHHFGRHGMGTKCSDFETIPLCHEHHIEGWHRHGTLPGRSRSAWLARWRLRAAALRARFEALRPAQRPQVAVVDPRLVERWREKFIQKFEARPPSSPDGSLCPTFGVDATAWLRSFVWPHIPDREEWSPLVTLHNGEVQLLAERTGNGGVFDVQFVLDGGTHRSHVESAHNP